MMLMYGTAGGAPVELHEPKRPGDWKPHAKVLGMAAASSGRTVWSVGSSTAILWDACSGAYLGTLQLGDTTKPVGTRDDEGVFHIDPAVVSSLLMALVHIHTIPLCVPFIPAAYQGYPSLYEYLCARPAAIPDTNK